MNPSVYQQKFERIANIMFNIILAPFPMNNGQVMLTGDFYLLISIMANFTTMTKLALLIFPILTDSQTNHFRFWVIPWQQDCQSLNQELMYLDLVIWRC